MNTTSRNLDTIDWQNVSENMNKTGYALLSDMLAPEDCDQLINQYNATQFYRKTIVMERYRFGLGEYKYFQYPLPELIQNIRQSIYPKLAPIANNWMKVLNIPKKFPDTFAALQQLCHENDQTKPTVLILKYGKGGHNTLHQDLYGEIFFPMQLVLFLNEPEIDYTGGEFVLMQQTPRAQSKAIVLKPKKGDILLFTTNFRPVKGSKGYHRVNMKHGVSEIHEGNRYTLGIIFHDALS
ncbi:2OG-Fe(II) oxygenase [Dyadobacter sp. LHD-138]|uniref:2OG-Fe(II) oxygenase n=1 Tax=Dyadobacter sp. LHD-138 TaxID=3071413 RepID=UPI0027E0C260|nr:2OG-Fe(II) oxygenase [Dyadobacter sp. LHD-138]MDQ6478202.1 2OG-Fe(II) oxygenase [Dyadobacter sp. LHD-138]